MQKPNWDSGPGMILLALTIILATVIFGGIVVSLSGCGNGGASTAPVASSHSSNGRWVNKTSANDDTFFALMDLKLEGAKAYVKTPQVDLNGQPTRPFTDTEMLCMQQAQPQNWSIRGLQSVPAAELNALPNCQHCPYTDPTPFIYCHSNPEFKYCNAYLSDGEISIPDHYLDFVGPWELSNKLLEVCHIDIGQR